MTRCPYCTSPKLVLKHRIEPLSAATGALYGFQLGSTAANDAGPLGQILGGTLGAFIGGCLGSALGSVTEEAFCTTLLCQDCGRTCERIALTKEDKS